MRKRASKSKSKKSKLAAMTPPYNKITRGDVITAAKRNAKKKKKG
jgi:hypothetical protein